jgi:hypothetical protein
MKDRQLPAFQGMVRISFQPELDMTLGEGEDARRRNSDSVS